MYRKNNRLKNYDYSQDGDYFITISCHRQRILFGNIINGIMVLNEAGKIANFCWLDLGRNYRYVNLGKHLIMPNHMHGILTIKSSDPFSPHFKPKTKFSIGKLIRLYKANVTRKIHSRLTTYYQKPPIWNKGYYDHMIRNEFSYYFIEEYIKNNPENWKTNQLRDFFA